MVKKGNIEGKIEMKVTIGGLRTPTVFISSTCYDLGHIRKDLKNFIEDDLGYDVMISEDSSFPIDPTKGTLDNCLNVVEKRADILILIIGSRYGSLTDSGKSITNLEYIKAKESGIPIYAFVNKSILDMLPVWKDNPNANFQSVVDNPRLFEFVSDLYNRENIWVNKFENVSDIICTLRKQLAYLFYYNLKKEQIILDSKTNGIDELEKKLIIEKPFGWTLKYYAHILKKEKDQLKDLLRDMELGLGLQQPVRFETPQDIIKWTSDKNDELLPLINSIMALGTSFLESALNNGDVDELSYAAKRVIFIYRQVVLWILGFNSLIVEDSIWEGFINASKNLGKTILNSLDDYINNFFAEIDRMDNFNRTQPEDAEFEFHITLHLNAPDEETVYAEMNKLRKYYGISV